MHPDFNNRDFDITKKISRLYKKHRRYCEMACNGEGYINGEFYNIGNKNAYINDDTTIFDLAIDKVEEKIIAMTDKTNFNVSFQRDPRGITVKLLFRGYEIEL